MWYQCSVSLLRHNELHWNSARQSKTSAHIAQHDIATIVTQQWYVCAKVAEGLLDLSQGLGVLSFDLRSNDSTPQTLEAMIGRFTPCHLIQFWPINDNNLYNEVYNKQILTAQSDSGGNYHSQGAVHTGPSITIRLQSSQYLFYIPK